MSRIMQSGERDSADAVLADLVEQITDRLQRGEPVSAAEYIERYPELSDALGRLFPALAVLEDLSGSRTPCSGLDEEPASGMLGDFRIMRKVGQGGMGVVYEAEQISLGRRVALKVLPFAATMDSRRLQRFQNEARAAASLEHPHIVPVYGVGCERGVHYYAMRFIDALTMAEFITQQRAPSEAPASPCATPETLPPAAVRTEFGPRDAAYCRRIAHWGIEAATGLEYAHSCGVVHRDIKPGNLLIDSQGKLWVTDFGLAKVGGSANVTMTGDVVGTLRYMSPEQALAKHELVDHRTDIYSLGVTLYELLAGNPAIPGDDRQEILQAIATGETPPLRTRNMLAPIELETIIHKAIAKEPNDRYVTAQELADDLTRFLNNQPLKARRPTVIERMRKWSRRNQAVLLAAFIVASLAILGLGTGTYLLWQEKERTQQALDDVDAQRLEAERVAHANRRYAYACDLKLAYQAWSQSQVAEARERLNRYVPKEGEKDVRNFAWHYLWRLCHCERMTLDGHSDVVFWATYAPDGQTLATCSRDYTIRLWDVASGITKSILRDHSDDVNSLSYSPDGKLLASASDDRTIRIWDTATGASLRTISFPHWMYRVSFSPDGKRLAASGQGRVLSVWDPATGQELWRLEDLDMIAFSPDSQLLAAKRHDHVLVLCDVARGTIKTVTQGHAGIRGDRGFAAFSPDGQTLVTPGPPADHLCFWDLKSGDLKFKVAAEEHIDHIGFSIDGARLVTTGTSHRVTLRDSRTGRVLADFRGHNSRSDTAAFSPDGKQIVSSGWDGCARIWDQARYPGWAIPTPPRGAVIPSLSRGTVYSLAYVRDDLLVFASEQEKVRTYDPHSRTIGSPPVDLGNGRCLAFAPRAAKLAVGTADGTVHVAGLDGSNHVFWKGHNAPVVSIALSPDATMVASDSLEPNRSATFLSDVAGQVARHTWPRHRPIWPGSQASVFLSDGRLVRVGDEHIEIIDPVSGALQTTLTSNFGGAFSVALAPQGNLLAIGGGHSIRLWDVVAGQPRLTLLGQSGWVIGLAFSPDENLLASCTEAGEVKLWDLASGLELFPMHGHGGRCHCIAFSPDGSTLVVGGNHGDDEGQLYFWTGKRD